MGLSPFKSSTAGYTYTPPLPPNPNPRNYQILMRLQYHDYLVLKIKYPDCTNYEGVKMLLFDKGVTVEQLEAQGFIDPHFDDRGLHPIARFEPTDRGLHMAVTMIEALNGRRL